MNIAYIFDFGGISSIRLLEKKNLMFKFHILVDSIENYTNLIHGFFFSFQNFITFHFQKTKNIEKFVN